MEPFEQYRLWIVAIFGGMSVFILAAIWHFYYFKRRKSHERVDFGLLFLCAGLLVWVILAILGLSKNVRADGTLHALSMINNGLIACSFPFFEYSAISDNSNWARKYWTAITLSLTVIVLILIYVFGNTVGDVLDFLSSSLVLIILTGILFKTFSKRNVAPLGYFSILIMVAMLISQFFITFKKSQFLECGSNFLTNLGFVMGGISFTMFILLLVALAFTWILDRSDVFDVWKEKDESMAFWQGYLKSPKEGIRHLKESLAQTGLSKTFFAKIIGYFDLVIPDEGKEDLFEELKNNTYAYSARFSHIINAFEYGILREQDYLFECNKISYAMISNEGYFHVLMNEIEYFKPKPNPNTQ